VKLGKRGFLVVGRHDDGELDGRGRLAATRGRHAPLTPWEEDVRRIDHPR
jgi:hypothetical protein